MSLASADSARLRRESMTTLGYYNLRLGPTVWRFSSKVGVEFNDNVQGSQDNPVSDVIFTPGINAQLLWPITDKNMLNLRLGAGYSAYVINPSLSRFYVDPGSEVSFDIYTGNFVVNVHDRFSINQYSYQDPTVAGNDYSRLENAAGLGGVWDMNKLVLRLGYDHINYVTLTGNPGQPDGASDILYTTAAYKIADQWRAGVEGGGGLITYNNSTLYPNAQQWNVGAFSEAVLTEYLTARGSVGFTEFSQEATQQPGISGAMSGAYFQAGINHRLNKYLTHALSGGRGINFSYYGGTVARYYVQWSGRWNIVSKTSVTTSLDYQTGEEANYVLEHFDWFGGSLTLGRQITRHSNASVYYRGYRRESNLPGRSYVVNAVGLQFKYDF